MKNLFQIFKIILVVLIVAVLGFIVINYHSDVSIEDTRKKYEYPDSKYLVVNSVEIHYREKGKGIPVVLIHGNGSSLHTWEKWIERIPDSVRVIALDLPGFGLSGTFENEDYSHTNYIKTLASFFSAINIDSAIVAGNSFGGNMTWKLAYDHPNLVRKMALLDASGYPRDSLLQRPLAFKLASTPIIKDIMRKVTPKSMFELSLKDAVADDTMVDEAYITRHFDLFLKEGNRKAFGDKNAFVQEDESQKISNIKIPTLILWGEMDTFVSVKNAYRFNLDIQDSKMIIYEGVGHLPMEEIPTRSFNDFYEFAMN